MSFMWVIRLCMSIIVYARYVMPELFNVYITALGATAGGNADNRNADITHDDPTLGFSDESVLNSFHSIQGKYVYKAQYPSQ